MTPVAMFTIVCTWTWEHEYIISKKYTRRRGVRDKQVGDFYRGR